MAGVVQQVVSQVLAEIQAGDALNLSAAGRLFPGHRGGRAVNPSTVLRWMVKGLIMPTGVVIRLEGVRVGTRWLTSSAAVSRFVTASTAASTSPDQPAPPPTPSPAGRQRAADRAAADLKAAGA